MDFSGRPPHRVILHGVSVLRVNFSIHFGLQIWGLSFWTTDFGGLQISDFGFGRQNFVDCKFRTFVLTEFWLQSILDCKWIANGLQRAFHFGLQMDCKRVGLQWIAEFQVFKTLSETSEFCRLQMYCRSDSIHLFDEIRSCTRRLRDGIEQETAIDYRNVERTHLVYKNQKIDGPSLNFNAFIHKRAHLWFFHSSLRGKRTIHRSIVYCNG